MHRAIINCENDLYVDHIDCDGLNNRRSNLRAANPKQNMHNKRISKRNKCGVKGVYWNKKMKKWHAQISANLIRKDLGYFDNLMDAFAAYQKESIILHGEFAVGDK